MQFKDIEGQTVIANKLTEIADSGRISHAMRFVGATAYGSLALAVAYAQYINCQRPVHYKEVAPGGLRADSCGECPSCKKYQALQHSDLHLYFPNTTTTKVKSKPSCAQFQTDFREFLLEHNIMGTLENWYSSIGIENGQGIIRREDGEDVVRTLSLKAYEAKHKVVVVWMAEKMESPASNCILKELEEPYTGTVILLVAESEDKLLSTVVSRTQLVAVPRPDIEGAVWVGDTMVREEEREEFAKMYVTWMRQLFKLNMASLAAWVENLAGHKRETIKQYLAYAEEAVRECYVNHLAGRPLDMDFGDEKFNKSFPTMITDNNIEGLCAAFGEAIHAIERNAYAKTALMELSFRISKQLQKR